jgi:hypothetical protein
MIQFPNFEPTTFEDANPWMKGAKFAQDALAFPQDMKAKMLANQIAQVQAKYADPMAQAELKKNQLFNKYYSPDMESQIGLRQAQSGKLGKETQWYDREAQARTGYENAETASLNAQAGMNKLKLDYFKSMMQSNNAPGMNNSTGNNGSPNNQTPSSMGADYSTSPQSTPPANTVYGIETPKLTKDDIANKMLLGTDTFTPRMQNAQKQQQDQYTQYQKSLSETIQEANTALKVKQGLSIFNNAMDNTTLKGAFWGETPSTGWRTLYHNSDSVKNAQIADNMAANILPGAIAELRGAMGQAQFSVYDMKAAGQMKVYRGMDDGARRTQSQWLNGVYDRMDEKAKFYTMMGNPKSGAQKTNADMLWEQYQQNFPLISKDGKNYQGSNLGNWPLYTTPRAIASIQSTGTYTPTSAEKSAFMMKLPDGRIVPVQKGKVEIAFKRGARPL